jgi:hypothetical protein
MSLLKKTKIVYMPDGGAPTDKEILVDAVINIDHISTILPGKKPGLLTIVMSNKIRYTVKEDLESLFKKEKEKRDNDQV